jgi:hypothetical protein
MNSNALQKPSTAFKLSEAPQLCPLGRRQFLMGRCRTPINRIRCECCGPVVATASERLVFSRLLVLHRVYGYRANLKTMARHGPAHLAGQH